MFWNWIGRLQSSSLLMTEPNTVDVIKLHELKCKLRILLHSRNLSGYEIVFRLSLCEQWYGAS